MAWGTSSCPKVEKIFGPGNQYVTAAKMILQNSEAVISIDMPAGPSEVLVIADKHANPVHIAADLLSQILIEVDHLQDVPTPYIQIKGVDKEAITAAGLMLRLDGFYTTKSYLEIILESLPQVERTSSSIRTQQAVKLQELMYFILSQTTCICEH